ncbi:hypothetical protein MHO82_09915 [Vibrio sp. Of7-15]|uniref:hypothetical protein n=1 Tax=Vibrio sp. Of7-15 TaxID=2724879 RepID=UPI001EF3C701|nr:hypothetical protein [Vibrio sp. Of7-15]MCG7497183.1 hypothetical protein [Vibrio sp. Of7-15]
MKPAFKYFISYMLVYFIVGILAAGVPFSFAGVAFGGISVTIASIALAILKTIEGKEYGYPKLKWKLWLNAFVILMVINVLVFVSLEFL